MGVRRHWDDLLCLIVKTRVSSWTAGSERQEWIVGLKFELGVANSEHLREPWKASRNVDSRVEVTIWLA